MTGDTANGGGSVTGAPDPIDRPRKAWARYTTIWLGFFRDYNVLLTPSMPVTAFELGRLAPSTINGYPIPPAFVSGSGVGFALRA